MSWKSIPPLDSLLAAVPSDLRGAMAEERAAGRSLCWAPDSPPTSIVGPAMGLEDLAAMGARIAALEASESEGLKAAAGAARHARAKMLTLRIFKTLTCPGFAPCF